MCSEWVKEWGKGRSFVEQDKASAVQCRRSSVFSKLLTPFPPLESILVGQLYSTAKIASERVVPRPHFERFRHARRAVLAMLGPVIAVAFLVMLGRFLGLRISLTDSAAPAGIYRLASGISVKHGELVGACLPASIAQEGLARGYLQKAIARAEPSRSRRLLEPFPATLWKCNPDGFPSTEQLSLTAPWQRATASADRSSMCLGDRTRSRRAKSGCSVSITLVAGTPATSDRFRFREFGSSQADSYSVNHGDERT